MLCVATVRTVLGKHFKIWPVCICKEKSKARFLKNVGEKSHVFHPYCSIPPDEKKIKRKVKNCCVESK